MSPSDDHTGTLLPSRESRTRDRQRRQTYTFLGLFVFVALVGFTALGNWQGWWTIGGSAEAAVRPCPVQVVSDPQDTEVNVYNGTNRNGLAAAVTKELAARDFSMLETGTEAQSKPLPYAAMIRYGPTGRVEAHTVALQFIGPVKLVRDKRDDQTVDVLLGEKYTQMLSRKKAAAAIQPKDEPTNCVPVTTPAAPVPSTS